MGDLEINRYNDTETKTKTKTKTNENQGLQGVGVWVNREIKLYIYTHIYGI